MNEQPVEVPVGLRADQWVTVLPHRRILLIAHNVTTVTRLLDILPAFDSDPRIQIVVSWSGSDPFHRGLAELLDELGLVTIGWDQARHTRFDLAIAASHHGGLSDITAPVVILSHGIGYTKYSPGNRKQETGNRKQETGNRKQETGNRKQETGKLSDFRRNGCFTTVSPSPPPSPFPTRNRSTDYVPAPQPPSLSPKSSATRAMTGSSPVSTSVHIIDTHWTQKTENSYTCPARGFTMHC
ncbi:hypothetical protein [Tamaricihabitans halophyticus]|uniref:hypothetical protein n=1 Tax=Tamaricihabitans halophyticus TaxID=1262583 RepID=UPI001045007F|nr:hypothetical protein [Tamaricihabitans halophyticus]